MRVPFSWLREYVDVDLSPEALAERLTLLGMEVQAIERRGADWERILVGELLAVEPHPGSDHLLVTAVRTRPGEPVLTILTGASNVAAGQRVPVAIPGAVLPGGRRIEVTTMVGRESQGMLCSGDELGLTIDADGILVLSPDAPVGAAMADVYGDVVLDVDVKPNRGDALSLLGLAREVAATTGARVRWPRIVLDEQGLATAEHISVEVTDEHLCPRFVGRYVDALDIGPSPLQVQARLTAAGVRPVSNVVDASNYVMLELGKPIHTFDAAAIADGHSSFRLARPGERLETLDHVARELSPDTLLIADLRCPLAIAGVMGGASSEVRDVTEAIVIESAVFDPVSIRRTARRYALRSEASLRFEKGQELRLARVGADRVAQLIAAWAGGRVAPGRVDSAPVEPAPSRVPFRPRRVAGLLGAPVERGEIRSLLARVEVETEPARPGDVVPVAAGMAGVVLDESTAPDALVAIIPTHRRDLEIEADIIEEVARVRGYELVPVGCPRRACQGIVRTLGRPWTRSATPWPGWVSTRWSRTRWWVPPTTNGCPSLPTTPPRSESRTLSRRSMLSFAGRCSQVSSGSWSTTSVNGAATWRCSRWVTSTSSRAAPRANGRCWASCSRATRTARRGTNRGGPRTCGRHVALWRHSASASERRPR